MKKLVPMMANRQKMKHRKAATFDSILSECKIDCTMTFMDGILDTLLRGRSTLMLLMAAMLGTPSTLPPMAAITTTKSSTFHASFN